MSYRIGASTPLFPRVARLERILASRRAGQPTTMTLAQIVEALRALASDPATDPEEAAQAEAMLEARKNDPNEDPDARNEAYRACERIAARRDLDRRMNVRCAPARVTHRGCVSTFPVLTAADAQAARARRMANGVPVAPANAPSDPRLERMRIIAGRGAQAPSVRREGRNGIFAALTAEEAQRIRAAKGK